MSVVRQAIFGQSECVALKFEIEYSGGVGREFNRLNGPSSSKKLSCLGELLI